MLSLLVTTQACTGDRTHDRTAVGQSAPDYSAVTLDGRAVTLTSLRGQVVLLNAWATWCVPCRREMPELQALHEKYGASGLEVIGVSVDAAGSDRAVREFLDELGVTYEIWRDPGERIAAAYGFPGLPSTFLIKRDGTIGWRRFGPFTSSDPELQRVLAEAL